MRVALRRTVDNHLWAPPDRQERLVRQSIADRDDAVYYQAVQGTATTQLRRFVEAAASTYPDITAVKEEWNRS